MCFLGRRCLRKAGWGLAYVAKSVGFWGFVFLVLEAFFCSLKIHSCPIRPNTFMITTSFLHSYVHVTVLTSVPFTSLFDEKLKFKSQNITTPQRLRRSSMCMCCGRRWRGSQSSPCVAERKSAAGYVKTYFLVLMLTLPFLCLLSALTNYVCRLLCLL
jgi:hypothetical protein